MIKNYQHTEKFESCKFLVRNFAVFFKIFGRKSGRLWWSNDGMIVDGKSVNIETYMVEQTMKRTFLEMFTAHQKKTALSISIQLV